MSQQVVFEVTERARLDVVRDVRRQIARLREMAFRGDLGAGYPA